MRVAVIGAGYWGKNLVRNFAQMGVLAGICDPNQVSAQKLAQEHNCSILELEELLAGSTVPAVAIAVPAVLHASLARRALEAGKHVFVEKPIALDVHEASSLCELAQNKGLTLMVGHLLHYHPAYLKLKEMVNGGQLGRLQYLYSNRLNLGKIRREEDILWSFAPHDLSMILGLVGEEPVSVKAVGGYYLHQAIADVTTTHLSFPSGVKAHVFVSWLHPIKEQKLVVIGEQGMVVFDDTRPLNEKLTFFPHKIEWREGIPLPEKGEGMTISLEDQEPLRQECQHFIDCVTHHATPRTDGYEALRVLKVLDEASKSLGLKLAKDTKQNLSLQNVFIHETACVDQPAEVGEGTKIWHFSHILGQTKIGKKCVIGQNVVIGPHVTVGNNCKIQNNVSLYKGVTLEDGVFCGPSCVFTNVNNPRAEIERKDEFRETYVERGVTIGANATIVCGARLGAYCFIGAGAVVTKDVKPHALVVGNPARQIGWMSHSGDRLGEDLVCPREKTTYIIDTQGNLVLKDTRQRA